VCRSASECRHFRTRPSFCYGLILNFLGAIAEGQKFHWGQPPCPPPGTAPVSGYRKNFMTISQRFKNYRVDKQTNKQTHKPTVLKTTHLASSNNYLSTCRPRLSCCREIFGHFLLHRFSVLFLPRAQYSEVVLFSVVYICMRVCVCVFVNVVTLSSVSTSLNITRYGLIRCIFTR